MCFCSLYDVGIKLTLQFQSKDYQPSQIAIKNEHHPQSLGWCIEKSIVTPFKIVDVS
jgi:hypothetical protein